MSYILAAQTAVERDEWVRDIRSWLPGGNELEADASAAPYFDNDNEDACGNGPPRLLVRKALNKIAAAVAVAVASGTGAPLPAVSADDDMSWARKFVINTTAPEQRYAYCSIAQ